MPNILYRSDTNITLIGAGPVTAGQLDRSLELAPLLIAADGGADNARELGHSVHAVIGDLDSLTNGEYWRKSGTSVNRIDEQMTTDFEKCLYSTEAPLTIGLGFMEGRADHALASYSGLLRFPAKKVILVGNMDLCFLCPPRLSISLPEATRISLYPLLEVHGAESVGLEWNIEDLKLEPGGRLGTSNTSLGGTVRFGFDRPGALVLLPPDCLEEAVRALLAAETWPPSPFSIPER
jgi:thiamine pyrophosphokinase